MKLLRSFFLVVACAWVLGRAEFAVATKANGDNKVTPKTTKSAAPKAKSSAADDNTEPAAKPTTSTQRDPFFVPAKVVQVPKPVKPVVKKPDPQPIPPPNVEARVTDYKNLMRNYLEGRGQEPSKTAPYLIDELTVTGIFRNAEGAGAFVVENATQKQQVFFMRTGWQTYDGVLKEILPTGVKFIRKTRLDNGTVRETEEFRALPVPNAK